MRRLLKFLKFEEESAVEIQNNPDHEKHTDDWNERYWHGYAAAMRRAHQRVLDGLPIGFTLREEE